MSSDLEKPIENAIFDYLALDRSIVAMKIQTQGVYDTEKQSFRKAGKNVILGTADILISMTIQGLPIFVALEVKSAKGVQSDNQIKFEALLLMNLGFYFVVRSVTDAQEAIGYVRAEVKRRITDLMPQ